MPLIPELEMQRQEGIWLVRERNISREDSGAQGIQFEDSQRQDCPLGLRIG